MAGSFSQSLFSDEADRSLLFADNLNLLCSACEVDQTAVPAVGYCVDCSEHLCANCYSHHRTPSAFRKHKLLDKHHMPRTKTYKDECTDECEIHVGEVLKYFCEDHQQFICSACVITESDTHRKCKVGYIPKLSKELFDNQEFRDFEKKLKLLKKQTCDVEVSARKILKDKDTHADRSMERIKQFRKEINEFFENLERNAVDQCSRIRKYNEEKISPLVGQSKHLGDKIEEIEKRIKDKKEKNQKCSLYADMKNLRTQLEECSTKIKRLEQTSTILEFSFSPSKMIQRLISNNLQSFGTFGGLEVIPAKEQKDKKTCTIDGIALLSNERIVVIDDYNEKMKIIDTLVGKVLTSMSVAYGTHGITSVSDHEFAAVQHGNIEIYSVTDATNEIKLQEKQNNDRLALCGIALAYSNNRFVGIGSSSFTRKISILDRNGVHIRTSELAEGLCMRKLFEYRSSMAIDPDHTTIYVSDWKVKTVVRLTFDGEVRAEYSPSNDWWPRDVVVSRDGTVYVADLTQNSIHILSSDLQRKCVIDGSKYGLTRPISLAYCDRDHKMFVGMVDRDEIVVIKMENVENA